MMNNLTESDFSFIDLEHYYVFSTVSEDYKRTYPVGQQLHRHHRWQRRAHQIDQGHKNQRDDFLDQRAGQKLSRGV